MSADKQFIEALASPSPTPGGGGASAYAGALAASLGLMVANLTVGKPRYADCEEELRETIDKLRKCSDTLMHLIDEDARAFNGLVATWKLPEENEVQRTAKHLARQRALVGACEVPIQIMRVCAKIIELVEVLAQKGTRLAVTDAGAAAALAKGALKSAALNVYINASGLSDRELAAALDEETRDLVRTFCYQADVIYDYVLHEVMH